ncbi:hypothetical protein G6F43_000081 [Rhizopus delemar]|nr:hypothetical protein G6F43_000081 [Rhizopus delemar]
MDSIQLKIMKRARTEDEQETKLIASGNYNFNFIPKLQPNQRIFDDESPEATRQLSAFTLTQRYKKRAKEYFNNRRITQAVIKQPMHIASSELSIIKHQNISYTIIIYFQMLFNIVVSLTVLYIFLQVILVIRQDFKLEVDKQLEVLYQKKMQCARDYKMNRCEMENKVPAIESLCQNWEVCMQKDVVVAKAKASAEAIAEIINSFTEPISYKTLIFFSILTIGSLLFSNVAFGSFRKKYKMNHSAIVLGNKT